jgi:hypothetical protein
MLNKIKALIWEECRVGGVIALFSWLIGTFVLLNYWYFDDALLFARDRSLYGLYIMGLPLSITAMLTLNPDHKGALHGGFSMRILELPIPTYVPVAISLFTRASFLFLTTALTIAVSQSIFNNVFGYEFVWFVTGLYLGMQILDWSRIPISGLSSFLLLLAISTFLGLMFTDENYDLADLELFNIYQLGESTLGIALILFYAAFIYILSLVIVDKTRKGRRYGIPEIWTWHRSIGFSRTGIRKPFQSPIAAQVWLEMRQSHFVFPIVTILTTILSLIAIIIYFESTRAHFGRIYNWQSEYVTLLASVAALFLGAIAHGIVTHLSLSKKAKGLPGYTYLHPLTHEQYATSRMLANLLLFIPTFAFSIFIQFSLTSGIFFTEIVPEAMSMGVTSTREVIWILLGRSLIFGLAVWAILSSATRFVGWLIPITVFMTIGLGISEYLTKFGKELIFPNTMWLLIIGCLGSFIYAWRHRLLSKKVMAFWLGTWTFFAGLIYLHSFQLLTLLESSFPGHLYALGTSFGIASLVAFPFISTLIDIRKKRHSASPHQNSTNNTTSFTWSSASTQGKILATGFTSTIIAGLWVAWPSSPSYKALWRSQGHPTNLTELNDWYKADGPNHASEYIKIMSIAHDKDNEFQVTFDERPTQYLNNFDISDFYEHVLIMGGEIKYNEIVPDDIRETTNQYWEAVTQYVTPELKLLTKKETGATRYPIDLLQGFMMNLEHLSKVRNLARHLRIDAWHSIWANDTSAATDSLLAILAVGDSLKNEPVLISGLVRIAVLGIAIEGIEEALNHAELTGEDLQRLQTTLQEELIKFEHEPILLRPMIGESILSLSAIGAFGFKFTDGNLDSQNPSYLPWTQLVLPKEADHLVTSLLHQRILKIFNSDTQVSPVSFLQAMDADENDELWQSIQFIAPTTAIMMPAMARPQEAGWRVMTEFEMAIVGISLERYHLATGKYPDSLNALVPNYLSKIPTDRYNPTGEALQYRITDEGKGFIVYSFSRNMLDDNGETKNHSYMDGDRTFRVTPLIKMVRDDTYYDNE